MPVLVRDGVRLAYEEAGNGPPMLLLHGWTCNRSFLQPQLEHFKRTHRVIALDQRGHGESDAPQQEYTMSSFADDAAWVCRQLGAEKPIVVGHSMGGVIAMVLGAEHPEVPRAIVALDSTILPTGVTQDMVDDLVPRLHGADGSAEQRHFVESLMFHPADDAERKRWIVDVMTAAPRHVMSSAFAQLFGFDHAPLVERCRVPWLSIFASAVHSDLPRLLQLNPALVVGQTVGAGHFIQLEVPDQVNPMIERFLATA